MGSLSQDLKVRFQLERVHIAGNLIMLDSNELSVNMIKQASAVITLLKEVAGLDTKIVSGFVIQEAGQESVSFR